jgi:septum formation protein
VIHHPLILASSSPRRHQLLTMMGIPHRVEAANVQEIRLPREAPAAYVERLARDKARAVPGAWVLGADTTVALGDEILEKPADADDALRMLRALQGRRHEVLTAVCLRADGAEYQALYRM